MLLWMLPSVFNIFDISALSCIINTATISPNSFVIFKATGREWVCDGGRNSDWTDAISRTLK